MNWSERAVIIGYVHDVAEQRGPVRVANLFEKQNRPSS
jgi:hypothetical protein